MQDVAGCATWVESTRCATIDILSADHYPKGVVSRGFDWECTLVHELLHCKFCLLSNDSDELQTRYVHQLIDDLARAFVDAKRRGDTKCL